MIKIILSALLVGITIASFISYFVLKALFYYKFIIFTS